MHSGKDSEGQRLLSPYLAWFSFKPFTFWFRFSQKERVVKQRNNRKRFFSPFLSRENLQSEPACVNTQGTDPTPRQLHSLENPAQCRVASPWRSDARGGKRSPTVTIVGIHFIEKLYIKIVWQL